MQRCLTYRPERWREVDEIVTSASCGSIIMRGAGRSYGDAALNDGEGVVLSTRLRRIIDFNEATGSLECEAGVKFDDLLRIFVPKGFFPPVTPGTKFITVGGAVAADVHGKNHHVDGSFASHVEAFTLLSADGTTLRCTPNSNSEIFRATIGGMGLTGVILSVRFVMKRIASSYLLVDYHRVADLDEVLSSFEKNDCDYQYSVAWMDCSARGSKLGRSILMRANPAHVDDLPTAMRRREFETHNGLNLTLPPIGLGPLLSKTLARQFNSFYFRRHYDRATVPVHYDAFFYPLDGISNWNCLYGRRGFWQYQSLFDGSVGLRGMVALLECLQRSRHACLLAVVKAFGGGSSGILSFPKRGYTLSLDIPNKRGSRDLLTQLDGIVREYGGRAYLAKDAYITKEGFREMYPSVNEFENVKARIDPDNRFSSSLARRIGLA